MRDSIFWPLLAQVALTAAVWVRLYVVRLGEIRRRRIDPQILATHQGLSLLLTETAPADNFRNLFEVPVLFFSACLALAVTGSVTMLQLALAWTFVALRVAHSSIHVTCNRVPFRFAVHVLGTAVVFIMWALLGVHLLVSG